MATKQIQSQKKMSPLVTSIDKLDFDTTANIEGEWFINEDLDLAYFSAFAYNSVPSDTSTDIDNDPWSVIDALILLRAPIKSSLIIRETIEDAHRALFEVPAKWEGQKPIVFGKFKSKPIACESSGGSSESPHFLHY